MAEPRATTRRDASARPRFVCIGGANIDLKMQVPAPIVLASSNPARGLEAFGGVARNVAQSLALAGEAVALQSVVGRDAAGDALLAHARACGIDVRGCWRRGDVPTGRYLAVLDPQGDLHIGLADMRALEDLDVGWLERRAAARRRAALIIADLNLNRAALQLLVQEAARRASPLVLVAVSCAKMVHLPADLRGVSLLLLNRDELATLAGRRLRSESALRRALLAVQARGVERAVVTLGAEGLAWTTPHQLQRLPTLALRRGVPREVTGAGDALAAALCAALVHDAGLLGDALAWRRACRHAQTRARSTLLARSSAPMS